MKNLGGRTWEEEPGRKNLGGRTWEEEPGRNNQISIIVKKQRNGDKDESS